MINEWTNGDYLISTNPGKLDIELVCRFLRHTYWAAGVPREVVTRSIEHSLVFGVYHGKEQVGFARVVTDYATFAYLADLFIIGEHRGQGLGKWLVRVITTHPELQGLRRWLLATADAHTLYRRVGFAALERPDRFMEKKAAPYGPSINPELTDQTGPRP